MPDNTFLHDCARTISERHERDLADVCIVVPAKRAGLFLRRELARCVEAPFIAPRIFTLPQYLSWRTGIAVATRTTLLFRLYSAHTASHAAPESFSQFMKWAAMAMDDFSDLDHYLVDDRHFFRELKDIREIEQWSFSQEPLSPAQEQYRQFWLTLGPLYQAYIAQEEEYPGYARLARGIATGSYPGRADRRSEHTWLVGLSSLTPAEERALEVLAPGDSRTFLWDADAWYVENPDHSAGAFLRTRNKGELAGIPDLFREQERELHYHECTTGTGEQRAVYERLRAMDVDELNHTVVVVMDESRVHSFLSGIPPLPVAVNVAMGMPLRHEPLFRLMRDLLRYHGEWYRQPDRGVYHIHFERIISNALYTELTGTSSSAIRQWMHDGIRIRIRAGDVQDFTSTFAGVSAFADAWFSRPLNPQAWLESAEEFVRTLLESGCDDLLRETAQRMLQLLLDIRYYAATYSWLDTFEDLESSFTHLISRETVSYSGEPLAGLQVLSMVETRAIDFRYVHVIGANEDLLPGGGLYQSLVPYDLRSFHKMPLPSDREHTYSYTFYRLLQRCKRADFYFATITGEFRGTEQSRYLTQLELEIPVYQARTTIRKNRVVVPTFELSAPEHKFRRNAFTEVRLREWMERGISPSSIGSYLRCPMHFYYTYVLGVREEETMEEQLDEAAFGSVAHKVMENFMTPFLGSFPSESDWLNLREKCRDRIEEAMQTEAPGKRTDSGFNLIQLDVMGRMLQRLIDFEIHRHRELSQKGIKHIVLSAEASLSAEIPATQHGLPFTVSLRGKADRIDQVGDEIFIIDYKSGKIKDLDGTQVPSPDQWFEPDNTKLIQILSYAYMYSTATGKDQVSAALMSLANIESGYHSMDMIRKALPDWKNQFAQHLGSLISEIYSREEFVHNQESRNCPFCRTS
ncbi:MAG: PD-(D/E)XK nuclease family protein [Flavobacteriales bacterium]